MKKVILIPDSFKGTMSSLEICSIMDGVIKSYYPEAQIEALPVADGGEGTVECFLEAIGGQRIPVQAMNPFMEEMQSFYGLVSEGKTAIVELAACAGLPLVENRRNPLLATTYGVGQLIADAASRGVKEIVLGLGGSSTNDGGVGMAAALGVVFRNQAGDSFVPTGGNLSEIASIDTSGLLPALSGITITAMCDVDNPLCGPHGASAVFGPQKGADPAMVEFLDKNLAHMNEIIKKDLGMDVNPMPGAGAAGGAGGGAVAFLGATLRSGIETVLDAVNFDQRCQGADLVLTGEGRIDFQSLRGKVIDGVSRRAQKCGAPVIAVVGDIGDNIEPIYDQGVVAVYSINRLAVPFSEAKLRSKKDLALTVDTIMRTIHTFAKA
ncbi:glycerate kinase [Oscillospiraceae bacterium MB08-C2-2]|nr:glycerate kinase [Oscillospiraceae bacterium MB08-C2-2]